MKNDDRSTHNEYRYGVSDAPQDADDARTFEFFLLCDNCGNCHHMIRVRRMTDAQKEAYTKN